MKIKLNILNKTDISIIFLCNIIEMHYRIIIIACVIKIMHAWIYVYVHFIPKILIILNGRREECSRISESIALIALNMYFFLLIRQPRLLFIHNCCYFL